MKLPGKALIFSAAVGFATATTAFAGPVEDRKEQMKTVVKNVRIAVPMAKGEKPFDAAAAKQAMEEIGAAVDKFVTLFPEGSGTDPKTEASPKIWENMKDFVAKGADLKAASAKAATAAGQGLNEFKGVLFGGVLKTCGACHDAYRIKKS